MPEPYRAALYYVPERADPLWEAGCAWLGRDPETGIRVPQPDVPEIAAHTGSPRRYGFHATLKPPIHLAGTLESFLRDAGRLAARLAPFALPPLRVTLLERYLVLGARRRSTELHALADACVKALDHHRVPESTQARARRAVGRTDSELRNLARWGYPMVLEDWRFHMTLSNGLEANPLAAAAAAHFAEVLALPRRVESLAVFVEPEAGADFRLIERLKLG